MHLGIALNIVIHDTAALLCRPFRQLELNFAVLLLRAGYEAVDELDFIPDDEFQKKVGGRAGGRGCALKEGRRGACLAGSGGHVTLLFVLPSIRRSRDGCHCLGWGGL